jgi:uncharacterized integral membrane protein|tara:strand:+ start:865 stop:1092 length:228 start_codon:yes stop_codon:yes gene_type:complete
MGLSTILFLISIIVLAIYSYGLLILNEKIVSIDLLFFNLDIEIGQIILCSVIIGILTTIFLEILFFSAKRRKKGE